MADWERARAQMVESQLRGGGITNAAILRQMRRIPREAFVAPDRRELAYADDIQWFAGEDTRRFMAAPATLAKLVKLADVTEADTVLDVGAATGYSTAVLAGLAASVLGLEQDGHLARQATDVLSALGIGNARVISANAASLAGQHFDAIIVQGALDGVPDTLVDLLAERGRLVALIRKGSVCLAHVFTRSGGKIAARAEFSAFLPPLYAPAGKEEFVF